MRFGSVCSGIEAASVAWEPLGWKAAWFSEIEPFPSAVLKHHYPDTPNLGDMTRLPEMILGGQVEAPDVFCGGTPCQAFSVAGLRRSLDDARGNLSLTFCEIANAIDSVRAVRGEQPCIVFWENVPGVLSTKDNAFGCFLAGLAGEDDPLVPPGGKWSDAGAVFGPTRTVAWRVLDAQFFGLAQRRKRVFAISSAREGFDPAAVLLEWEGVRRDSAPSREAGQRVANALTDRADRGGTNSEGQRLIVPPVAETLIASDHKGPGHNRDHNFIAQPVGITLHGTDGTQSVASVTDLSSSLRARIPSGVENSTTTAVMQPVGVFQDSEYGVQQYDSAGTLRAGRIPEHQMVMQPIAWDEELNPSMDQAGTLLRGGAGGRHDGVAVPVPMINMQGSKGNAVAQADGPSFTLNAMHGHDVHAVAVDTYNHTVTGDYTGSLTTTGGPPLSGPGVLQAMQVRRLTPTECERLQGFPDNYTAIPWRNKPASECPDGPRYKALGNSWAVPVVRWIGLRIDCFATLL